MEIPEEVKSAWKEYSALKLGMIKSIKFGKDSSEKYYIDKKIFNNKFFIKYQYVKILLKLRSGHVHLLNDFSSLKTVTRPVNRETYICLRVSSD